jgi:hypothetical protein
MTTYARSLSSTAQLLSAPPAPTVFHTLPKGTARPGYTIGLYVCRSSSAAGVLVMSRAPRPWVAKLMNQRMKTIRRFWKPTR